MRATQTSRPESGTGSQRTRGRNPAETDRWDLLLVCAAVYVATAVGRMHSFFKPVELLKPTFVSAALGLLLLIFGRAKVRALKGIRNPVSYTILFILFWATVGFPFGLYRTKSLLFLLHEAYEVGALFLLVAASVRNIRDVRRLVYVYGASVTALAIYALAHGRTDNSGRLTSGVDYDPNDLAFVLVAALPILFYALGRAKQTRLKVAAGLGMLLIGIATVRTESRGGFLALLAAVGYTLLYLKGVKPKWRWTAFAALFVLFVLSASGGYWQRMGTIISPGEDYNSSSLTGRIQVWKRGVGFMIENPVFGVGVDNFSTAQGHSELYRQRAEMGQGTKWSPPHSAWVQVGAELGFPGLIAFAALFFHCFSRLRRLSRFAAAKSASAALQEGGALAAALFAVVLALIVAASFLTQAFGYALWAAFGLVVGLEKAMNLEGARAYRAPRRQPWRGHGGVPQTTQAAAPLTAS